MGCRFSLSSFSCSCEYDSPNTVRLVHFNGYVEDSELPITMRDVTGKPPNQYLCTADQLLSAEFASLKPDDRLQPGHLYFVLPLSTLQDEVSTLDMESVVKRLTDRAKSYVGSPETRPLETVNGGQKRRSWKPVLNTISEVC